MYTITTHNKSTPEYKLIIDRNVTRSHHPPFRKLLRISADFNFLVGYSGAY